MTRGPYEWPIRAFLVELTLVCVALLVAICVLVDRIGQLEKSLEFQQRQIDGVYCQLEPAPTTSAGERARRKVCEVWP